MSGMSFCGVKMNAKLSGGLIEDHVYLDVIVSEICEEVIIAPP
jgi:hypothetical protein